MINAIGEAAMQQTVRVSYQSAAQDKQFAVQKSEQLRAQRPVEKSEDSSKPQIDLQYDENTTTRNNLEDGKLVVERYDEDGRLIRKIPPGYLPFGEIV